MTNTSIIKNNRAVHSLSVSLLILIAIYSFEPVMSLITNEASLQKIEMVLCIFKKITGIPCPLCGLTRSAILTSQGNFVAALSIHPLGLLFIAAVVFNAVFSVFLLFSGKSSNIHNHYKKLVFIGGILLITTWLIRLLVSGIHFA